MLTHQYFNFGSVFSNFMAVIMVAVFLENTVFSRALGTSTVLIVLRKKISIWAFGATITFITLLASVGAYFITPFLESQENSYYIAPMIFIGVISITYLLVITLISFFGREHKQELLNMVHMSAFNCAVLGALLLSFQENLTFIESLGFGLGTGAGFTMAMFFLSVAYEKLYGEHISKSFRGFPITLIYIGIVSMAFYGLIGHELPF